MNRSSHRPFLVWQKMRLGSCTINRIKWFTKQHMSSLSEAKILNMYTKGLFSQFHLFFLHSKAYDQCFCIDHRDYKSKTAGCGYLSFNLHSHICSWWLMLLIEEHATATSYFMKFNGQKKGQKKIDKTRTIDLDIFNTAFSLKIIIITTPQLLFIYLFFIYFYVLSSQQQQKILLISIKIITFFFSLQNRKNLTISQFGLVILAQGPC